MFLPGCHLTHAVCGPEHYPSGDAKLLAQDCVPPKWKQFVEHFILV